MNFDEIIDRRNTHSAKWDEMESIFGVPSDTGLPMWVADMDFRPPHVVQAALQAMSDHGIYGYYGQDDSYRAAITWWMQTRHGWTVDPAHIFSTHGLVNGTALCVDAFTDPGDGVVLMTPVYHAFFRVIKAAGRTVVECEMGLEDGKYVCDFDRWDAQMTGSEKMLVLCSPHNPGGRVWRRDELEQIAAFARRHDLIVVSDEIHHDLVFPGQTHIPMALIEGIEDRLIMMSAPTKTFNLAGIHTGNVIISDDALRARFAARMAGLGISPNSFGLVLAEAAYSPEGAKWVDALMPYLDANRQVFDDAIAAIPGLSAMPLEATYLAWVDTSGTGMPLAQVIERVQGTARIAPNHGTAFGAGGDAHLRFNLAMPRAHITEAVARLRDAFNDLQ